MHLFDPFLLDLDLPSEASSKDWDKAIAQSFAQQELIKKFLKGEESLEVILDCAETGIDAYDYLDLVTDAIDYVIDNQIPIEGIELLNTEF